MAADEFPVKITITGHMERIASINANERIKVCDNSRGNSYWISPAFWLVCQADGGTNLTDSSPAWSSFTGTGLKNQYLALSIANTATCRHTNRWTVKITTHKGCTAPTTITVPSTAGGMFTLSWSGATKNDGTISGYEIAYQDQDASGNWGSWTTIGTVSTSATSGSAIVGPQPVDGRRRRFRIRTVASNSAYTSSWSSASSVVLSVRPKVTVGDTLTKTQMDSLKSWKALLGITATAVTQNNLVTATQGNTYKPAVTLTSADKTNATWYNTD